MTVEEIQTLVDAAVARALADPEAAKKDKAARELARTQLEAERHRCLSRRAMITERMVDPVRFYTACREVLEEITPRFNQLRDSIAEANKTGANRRPFERELDALEQVLDGLLRGRFGESGNLEEMLRAKGVPSSSPKYFSNRRSLQRTQAVIAAWQQELDSNEKRLAEVEQELAEVTAKLSS